MATTILSPPSTHPGTTEVTIHSKTSPNDKEKVDKLFDEYRREWTQFNNMNDRRRWMRHVWAELGSKKLVDQLLGLCSKYLDDLQAPRRQRIRKATEMTVCQIRDCLDSANWKGRVNEECRSVTCWLGHSTGRKIPLGAFHGSWLALHINNKAIHPQEPDNAMLAQYEVAIVNPKSILGMQYKSLEESATHPTQTMIVVQFGRIFSTSIPEGESTNPEKREWYDTGFVLVLEIQESGNVGSFYFVYDLTYVGSDLEPASYEIDKGSKQLMLCGKWLPFSVAKVVNGRGYLPLLKDNWSKMDEIQLERVSDTAPAFVESGLRYKGEIIDAYVAPFANLVGDELEEQIDEQREEHEKVEKQLKDRIHELEMEMQTFKARYVMLENSLERERQERARLAGGPGNNIIHN